MPFCLWNRNNLNCKKAILLKHRWVSKTNPACPLHPSVKGRREACLTEGGYAFSGIYPHNAIWLADGSVAAWKVYIFSTSERKRRSQRNGRTHNAFFAPCKVNEIRWRRDAVGKRRQSVTHTLLTRNCWNLAVLQHHQKWLTTSLNQWRRIDWPFNLPLSLPLLNSFNFQFVLRSGT